MFLMLVKCCNKVPLPVIVPAVAGDTWNIFSMYLGSKVPKPARKKSSKAPTRVRNMKVGFLTSTRTARGKSRAWEVQGGNKVNDTNLR